jgi:hypothetical protein
VICVKEDKTNREGRKLMISKSTTLGKRGRREIVSDDNRISAVILEIPEFRLRDFQTAVDNFLTRSEEEELKICSLKELLKQFPLRNYIVRDNGNCYCLECWALWCEHEVKLKREDKGKSRKIHFFCPETGQKTVPYLLPDQQRASTLARFHAVIILEAQKIAAGLMVATIELFRRLT